MAANYWASTQRRHWHFTRQRLAQIRERLEDEEKDLIRQYPLPDRRVLCQFFLQQLTKLGKRLSVRQQALATAQVFMKRFYTKVEIRRINPYLLTATALYLACKMEECPQHIRVVVSEARQTWPGSNPLHFNKTSSALTSSSDLAELVFSDIAKLGECEFYLISELNSHLIIHHPYRTLTDLTATFSLAPDETSLAWSIINDHYLTDLPLLHPPHLIAVTAISLAIALKPTPGGHTSPTAFAGTTAIQLLSPKETPAEDQAVELSPQQKKAQRMVTWLAEGELDLTAIVECTQELISLYVVLEQHVEKTCKEQIARFVRGRGLEK